MPRLLLSILVVATLTPFLAQSQTTPPPSARVRSDGLYLAPGKDSLHYLRFYDDGTVVSTRTVPQSSPQEVARWLNKSSDSIGQFTVNGSNIAFSTRNPGVTTDYNGTISGEVLKLEWHSPIRDTRRTEEYTFVAVAAEFLAEEPPKPPGPSVTLTLSGRDGVRTVKARLGQSGPGEQCPFIPLEVPEYPRGTTLLAYEVTIDPPPTHFLDIGAELDAVCSNPSTKNNRCNRDATLNGRPGTVGSIR